MSANSLSAARLSGIGHITVRRPRFALSNELPLWWHGGDAFRTHLFDATSILFPVGERFFVDTVRAFSDRIDDERLRAEIRGFMGQEAVHGRVHEDYNGILRSRGYEVDRLEGKLSRRIALARRFLSDKTQLAAVLGYEHLTAILADAVLRHPVWLDGAHPLYAALWRWHAAEETEHKAVAFDVYRASGGGYLRRAIVLAVLTALFMKDVLYNQAHMLRRDGRGRDLPLWWRGFRFLWISPGIFRRLIPAYLAFYRPGFHPWNRDNKDLVDRWRDAYDGNRDEK